MSVDQNFDDEESKEAIGYLVSAIKSWRNICAYVRKNKNNFCFIMLICLCIGSMYFMDHVFVNQYSTVVKKHNELLKVHKELVEKDKHTNFLLDEKNTMVQNCKKQLDDAWFIVDAHKKKVQELDSRLSVSFGAIIAIMLFSTLLVVYFFGLKSKKE